MKVDGPKGAPKPQYFDDPAMDALYQMVLVLGEEVAVLHEQMHALLALNREGRLPTPEELDRFSPGKAFDEERARFAGRLLEPVQDLVKHEVGSS